jgi:3'-5' exonuclease
MQTEKYLVFDIETAPLDWDSFSESQQEYLLRRADTEEEIEKRKNEMALTPLTAHIVCVGMQLMQMDENGEYNLVKKAAYSSEKNIQENEFREEILSTGDKCYICHEKRILEDFWKILKKYRDVSLITFNGRNFDAPFMMLRSAVFKIKPSRNIMSGTKFNYKYHIDLLDELTYFSPGTYGATRRFNFDFYARAFGIQSPKAEGIDGSKVAVFYDEGKVMEISEYCLRDVTATWELYLYWKNYLSI